MLSIRSGRDGVQALLPAKSSAQWRRVWGPSLKALVAIVCAPERRALARLHPGRPPLAADHRLGAEVLGQRDAGAVDHGLAEAHAGAAVRPEKCSALGAAPPAGRAQRAADLRLGSRIVLEGDRQRPQARTTGGSRSQRRSSARRAEQAGLEGPARLGEAGDEGVRGRVGSVAVGEDVEAAAALGAEPLLEAVVEGVPPGAADVDDPGPGRGVPAPAGEAGAGDGAAVRRG